MEGYLAALGFATLPIAGNVAGGLLAEFLPYRKDLVSYSLHAAAGVVLAVIGLELMPEALSGTSPWVPIVAFVLGGSFFLAADRGIDAINSRLGEGEAGPWMIYFGVAIDLFSDGIMIGTGSVIASSLGLILALGQVPADLPEGFAVVATFRSRGIPRIQRIGFALAFALPILLGVTIGYWLVRGQPAIVQHALLAFTGGILATVVVEEMVPTSHEGGEARGAALALVGGFALFALISTYVG